MGWVILTILLGIAGSIGLLIALFGSGEGRFWGGVATGVTAVVWVIASVLMSVHTIGQLHVGIPYSFSGTIAGDKPVSPGVVFIAPWKHIKQEKVGIQREDFDLGLGDQAASTKDQQQISAHVTVNYHVEPNHVIDLYKRVGPSWKKILLDSRALQDFKEVVSQYTAAQVTTERPALRRDTKRRLAQELAQYDVHVDDVFVTNLGYTQSYRDAVSAKNVQVQQALQAQAKVAQSTAEAEQEVAQAKGDKLSAIARAEGTAKANHLISGSITDKLIAMTRAQALGKASVIYVPMNWTAFGNLGAAGK